MKMNATVLLVLLVAFSGVAKSKSLLDNDLSKYVEVCLLQFHY